MLHKAGVFRGGWGGVGGGFSAEKTSKGQMKNPSGSPVSQKFPVKCRGQWQEGAVPPGSWRHVPPLRQAPSWQTPGSCRGVSGACVGAAASGVVDWLVKLEELVEVSPPNKARLWKIGQKVLAVFTAGGRCIFFYIQKTHSFTALLFRTGFCGKIVHLWFCQVEVEAVRRKDAWRSSQWVLQKRRTVL